MSVYPGMFGYVPLADPWSVPEYFLYDEPRRGTCAVPEGYGYYPRRQHPGRQPVVYTPTASAEAFHPAHHLERMRTAADVAKRQRELQRQHMPASYHVDKGRYADSDELDETLVYNPR